MYCVVCVLDVLLCWFEYLLVVVFGVDVFVVFVLVVFCYFLYDLVDWVEEVVSVLMIVFVFFGVVMVFGCS